MPFKSEAQRKYLYANEPEVAEEFESATPKGADLPERVGKKKKKEKKMNKKAYAMGFRMGLLKAQADGILPADSPLVKAAGYLEDIPGVSTNKEVNLQSKDGKFSEEQMNALSFLVSPHYVPKPPTK